MNESTDTLDSLESLQIKMECNENELILKGNKIYKKTSTNNETRGCRVSF